MYIIIYMTQFHSIIYTIHMYIYLSIYIYIYKYIIPERINLSRNYVILIQFKSSLRKVTFAKGEGNTLNPCKPPNTIVLGWSGGFQGGGESNVTPHTLVSRTAVRMIGVGFPVSNIVRNNSGSNPALNFVFCQNQIS